MKTKSLEGIFFNVCELNDKRDCRGLSLKKYKILLSALFLSVFQPFPLILCLFLPLSPPFQRLLFVLFLPFYHSCSVPFLFLCYILSTLLSLSPFLSRINVCRVLPFLSFVFAFVGLNLSLFLACFSFLIFHHFA